MPCGACGGAGHNRRTCDNAITVTPTTPNTQKEKEQTPKAKKIVGNGRTSQTLPCNICGTPGHSGETCIRLISGAKREPERTPTPPTSAITCGSCGICGHNRRTCPTPTAAGAKKDAKKSSTPSSTPSCKTCGVVGHNGQSCPGPRKKLTFSPREKLGMRAEPSASTDKSIGATGTRENGHGKNGTGSRGSPSEARLPSELDKRADSKKDAKTSEPKSPLPDNKGSSKVEDAAKSCGLCRETGHNRRSCPEKKPEDWFRPIALERLSKGLTEKDEPGYIYMYMKNKPESIADENWFKIGQSKILPDRRVRHLASRNKEDYKLLWSEDTPYRFLTENVIHKQLEPFHAPKEEGEGKTEWFMGHRHLLTENARKVIREIRTLHDHDRIKAFA